MQTPSLRYKSKSKSSNWYPQNTPRTGCGADATLPSESIRLPRFCRRRSPVNHPVREKTHFEKLFSNYSLAPAIVYKLAAFLLFMSELNSRATPSSLSTRGNSTGLAKLASAGSESHDSISGSIRKNSPSSPPPNLFSIGLAAVKSLHLLNLFPRVPVWTQLYHAKKKKKEFLWSLRAFEKGSPEVKLKPDVAGKGSRW